MSCENWIVLKEDSDYEINDKTFQIRRKVDKYIMSEIYSSSDGYLRCVLHKKSFQKHRIIANNFIPNPNNYHYVDHINRDRTDNRICNLRWCSNRMNCNNQARQNFVDEISDEAIIVQKYGGYVYEDLYFDPETDTFYVFNGINYVVKPRFQNKAGNWNISIRDVNNKQRRIYYNKFKREYGLI